MAIWLILVWVGALTYAMRASCIGLLGKVEMPPAVQRALRFVPVTVLPAMIAQELAVVDAAPDVSLHNPRLLAGVLAILVAWRTGNAGLTIVVGMGALLVLQALPVL